MLRKHLKDVCLTFWFSFKCSVVCILSQLLCSVKKLKQEVLLGQCCLHLVKWSIYRLNVWERFTLLKEVSYAHKSCNCLKKNMVKTVVLWNIIKIWNNCFLFNIWMYNKCKVKLNFQHHFSSLQCHMIFFSETLLKCWLAA